MNVHLEHGLKADGHGAHVTCCKTMPFRVKYKVFREFLQRVSKNGEAVHMIHCITCKVLAVV